MREVILYTLANAFNLTVMLQKYNDRACGHGQYFWCGLEQYACSLTNDLSYITEKQNLGERLSLKTERIFYVRPDLFTFVYMHMQGCQPSTSSNIEN